MLKQITICAALTLLPSLAAQAEECKPLLDISEELAAEGIDPADFTARPDAEFIAKYLATAGVEMPSDSDPIGYAILRGEKFALVSIIESGLCIKKFMVIPLATHDAIMAKMGRSI
jgi:hypothetical protein